MSAFHDFLAKWRKSSGNRLFDLLVSASKPVKDMPERKDMLELESVCVVTEFGKVETLAISGDSLDKLLVKGDGSGSPEENADVAAFTNGDVPPVHLVECKYRLLPGGGKTKPIGAVQLFEKVFGQIGKTRTFLDGEGMVCCHGGFLVVNHEVASTLYDVLESEKSAGTNYDFEVGTTEDLKVWLAGRGVSM